jgi:predicted MFS family arabinose efflux permease
MKSPDSLVGRLVLAVAYVAGMIDMVALPIWIGALMQHYLYSAVEAGLTVTLFLLGVVLSSLTLAPFFNRLPRKWVAAVGYAVTTAIFLWMSFEPVHQEFSALMAGLHFLAGLGAGCGLSMTDGVLGRTANPHKSWGIVNLTLGIVAVLFMVGVPNAIVTLGAPFLFKVFGALTGLAVIAIVIAFPKPLPPISETSLHLAKTKRISRNAWFVILAFACMSLKQAMVFSFVERIGSVRGFTAAQVNGVLVVLGLVNLLPGLLAVVLQKYWPATTVGIVGPIGQAALALGITHASVYAGFAVSAAFYVFMVIFTHTFLFGLLAKLDPSGRAGAATPAAMMVGSCIGPILGGVISETSGYASLGWAACVVSMIAVISIVKVRGRIAERSEYVSV